MNRTSKKIKLESHSNSKIDASSNHRNGDRVRSGHYMTSCLNDDDNNDVEVPIASPDLANDNDVAVTDTDEIKDEQTLALATTPTVITTTLQTSAQLQNQTNRHYKSKNQQNGTSKLRANDDNNVGMIMANTVVIRPVNLPVKTNDGSISGGLTFDKQNTSLKNLIYYIKHAYSSNLTSPKWKNFKGIKLQVAEKIRLNNVIWRTWFEQYGIRDVSKRKKSLICQFTNILETTKPPKVTVLEGKYWKRRLDSITTEYKKWRELSRKQIKSINDTLIIQSDQSSLDKVAQISNNNNSNNNSNNNTNNNNYSILNNDNNLNSNSICTANNNNNNNQQLNQLINNSSVYENNNLQINVQTPIVNNSFYLSNANSLSNSSLNTSSSSSNFNNFYNNSSTTTTNNNNVYYPYNNEQNNQLNQQNDLIHSNNSYSNYSSTYNNQFNSITNIGSPYTPMTPANLNSYQHTQQNQQYSSNNTTKQTPYNNRMRSPSPGLFDFDFFNISSDTLFSTYNNQDAKDTGMTIMLESNYMKFISIFFTKK
jgi:hypothetical protein